MSHQHNHGEDIGDQRLVLAVAVNVILTLAQVIGGRVCEQLINFDRRSP